MIRRILFCRALDGRAMSIHYSLALGPHPQRELTLMPRLGFPCPRFGMAAGASSWKAIGPYHRSYGNAIAVKSTCKSQVSGLKCQVRLMPASAHWNILLRLET